MVGEGRIELPIPHHQRGILPLDHSPPVLLDDYSTTLMLKSKETMANIKSYKSPKTQVKDS